MPTYHLDQYERMSVDELDAALFGLAVECPFGECDRNCPIGPLRKAPLRERFLRITGLDRAAKLRLMGDLVGCFTALEGQNTVPQNT